MVVNLNGSNFLSDLTAIVPIDLQFRPKDILSKVTLMLESSKAFSMRIVFSHNDRGSKFDSVLKDVVAGHNNVKLLSKRFYEGIVNASILRNEAFSAVSSKYLVLLDVDLWLDHELLKKSLFSIALGAKPFVILPCLYLSQAGSQSLLKGKSIKALRENYFSFSRKDYMHLANPSSVVIMLSADYEVLKGFDNAFLGHGYEDFDFMMRLASKYELIKPSRDFFSNPTVRSPLFVQGFRRELGRLCIDSLIDKEFFVHMYHAKSPESNEYYAARVRNFSRFCGLYKNYDGGEVQIDPTLITEFVSKCVATGKDVSEYSIYFENKPGHIDRFDTLRRRLKFLFG
jgi:predicted glycosyltransferase involved in capsule biosynthesis